MASVTDFKNLISADVHPCPDPMINRECLSAIIEFCEKTQIIKRLFNHVMVPASISSGETGYYDIDTSSLVTTMRPTAIKRLLVDAVSKEVERLTILNAIPDWDDFRDLSLIYYDITSNTNIRLFNAEATWVNATLEVAFKPTRLATTVEDLLLEDWSEPILARAKSNLMSMPGKDWSDPGMARLSEREWRRGLSRASAKVTGKGSNESQHITYQPFGGGF